MASRVDEHDRLRQRRSLRRGARRQGEARSVNHRYSDICCGLPKGYQALEERIRRVAAEYVQRGRVEIFVTIEEYRAKERTVRLDHGLLKGYLEAFSGGRRSLGLPAEPDLDKLLAFPDVLTVEEVEVDVEAAWPLVEEALREAFSGLIGMRRSEGERLYVDIAHRLSKVEQIIQQMAARAPLVVDHYRTPVVRADPGVAGGSAPRRVQVGLGGRPLRRQGQHRRRADPGDAATSPSFARCALTESGVGRKLDFLLQELHREMNTIASKAHDAQLPLGSSKQGGDRKDSRASPKHRVILGSRSWMSGPDARR